MAEAACDGANGLGVQMVGNPCRVIRKITEKDHMPDGIEKN